jgi:L-ascorbate metabolism protein UlaG (beta-lactamase superfamily)
MHVTFLGHAQLLVKAAGKTLLIDPWFAEPVFAGAWWRYPPPPYPTPESLPAQPDFLVLSHAHPDHSGPGTLALLDPALPTLAPRFPEDPLPGGSSARASATCAGWRAGRPANSLPG